MLFVIGFAVATLDIAEYVKWSQQIWCVAKLHRVDASVIDVQFRCHS